MHSCRRLVAIVLLLCLGVGFVPAASAQDEKARAAARALAQEGAQLYENEDFQGALAKFKQAYEQFPSPKLFLNIGQALRGLWLDMQALEAFERFLAEAKDASPEFVELARGQVTELWAKLARVTVECNQPGAVVTMDGQRRGTIPLGKPLVVEPGKHQLTVTWAREIRSVDFVAVAGQELLQTATFENKLPPLEPVVVAPPPEPQILPPVQAQAPVTATPVASKRTWYWIAGGAVVAAVATTVIILLGSRQYPDADLGSRSIGGSP